MQQDFLIAICTGLGAMLAWGLADFFAKKTIDKIGDYPTLFWSQMIGILPLLLILFFTRSVPTISNFNMLLIVVFGLVDAISWILLYRAFEKGNVSLLSPIFSSYAAGAVLISAFIFGESIPSLRWVAFAIISAGIILASVNIKSLIGGIKVKGISGLPEIITALLLFAFWVAFWGNFTNGKDWVFYVLLLRIVVVITIFIACKVNKISLTVSNNGLWMLLAIIGLFDVCGYSLISIGFSQTKLVSIVAMLSGAFPLPTIILARIFLKEKTTRIQAIGSLVIILGIMFLALV